MKGEEQKQAEENAGLESHLVYQGKKVALRLDTLQFGHQTRVIEVVVHPGAVVMIPIDPQGRIVLVRQWRRAAGQILIELPAGSLEAGEDPKTCAQRELQEEIGFRAKEITSMGGFFSAPGFCSEYLHLFLAQELELAPLPPDEDEAIDLLYMPLDEVLILIEQGLIVDAKTIAGILRYALLVKS